MGVLLTEKSLIVFAYISFLKSYFSLLVGCWVNFKFYKVSQVSILYGIILEIRMLFIDF